MAVTPISLRELFPAFSSTTKYPNAMVQTWLNLAAQFVNLDRWGAELVDYGQSLWAAHHLILAAADDRVARLGGAPGGSGGLLSSKSGGGLSASYDVSSITEQGAGFWNQTAHGREFYRLTQMMGIGPLQVGTDGGVVQPGAWPGPVF